MQNQTIIWICAFLGAFVYFLLKARKNVKDADAAGLPLSFLQAFANDGFDLIIALVLVFVFLVTGGTAIQIPGLNLDFSTGAGAFLTGAAISYAGVNFLLGTLGLSDRTRKKVRATVKG